MSGRYLCGTTAESTTCPGESTLHKSGNVIKTRKVTMRTLLCFCTILLAFGPAIAAEKKAIVPSPSPAQALPYSPGLLANEFLYVSGQGAKKVDGSIPISVEDQLRQCF